MPPSPAAVLEWAAPVPRPLRVLDVTVWYGARSGGIRTYLDAKARVAAETGAFEHHVALPAAHERHSGGRHELAGVLVSRANDYRMPVEPRSLLRTLRALRPDVVLLHDPFWWPASVVAEAHRLGATVIAVHHGSAAAGALGRRGPTRIWHAALSASQRRLYERADAVMAFGAAPREAGGAPILKLRYGVDPEFRPNWFLPPRRHVLYVGRLAPEKGVDLLLDALARTTARRALRLVGSGPAERALRRHAERLGIRDRVSFDPFIADRAALARAYAEAACVVVPGAHETFGLVALEAAASGAVVLASDAVPAACQARRLIRTFPAGDAAALARALDNQAGEPVNRAAAEALGRRFTWRRAIAAEHNEIRALCG